MLVLRTIKENKFFVVVSYLLEGYIRKFKTKIHGLITDL